ncbi:MAG TPA: ATP synthase F0 subunit C [Thermoanaerobaculia bacterium]|jgi:F-type H+-transporting ATPase subunit c|nr:ATP synthase F0 subunit C [Thermoanaerobaculia bacterium]
MTAVLLLLAVSAFAQGPAANTTSAPVSWNLISASFLLAIAAAAGAIGQSRGIAAACEGIARNPSAAAAIRLAMIIGLALIESLVIYALIIAYLVMNK